jgi:hypothetical protein
MLDAVNPAVLGSMVAGAIFGGVLVSLRFGRWLGKRAIQGHGAAAAPNVGSLEAAVFALLGLIIAFTFSGALQRFDTRRAQVVQEANAIGTAWLRLDLLPAQAQPKLRDTFKAYVDARIATYRVLPDIAAARNTLELSRRLQADIWQQAVAAARLPGARPDAPMLLVPALNDMFDITTVRVAATQIHPPAVVYGMLLALSLIAALLAGYQSAGERGYDWIHKLAFAGIVALTVYVILDIEYPRMGLVRIDAIDRLLVDVRAGMK